MSVTTSYRIDQISLFDGLSKQQRRRVAQLMTPVRVPAGRVLARQGDPGREFLVIAFGHAAVHRDGHRIAVLGPGDFFGELALIGPGGRTATVTAETDMALHVMTRREFSSLLAEFPAVAYRILMGATRRLHQQLNVASLN